MAASLKAHSLKLNAALVKDNEDLDEIAAVTDSNITGIRKVIGLVERSTSSCGSLLNICLMMAVVVVLFVGTFLVIQLVPKRVGDVLLPPSALDDVVATTPIPETI